MLSGISFVPQNIMDFPPADDNNPYTNSLILWPLITGGYKYGVLLYEDDVQYQIYVDENGNAVYGEDRRIVSEHAREISILLEKAKEKWA